MTLSNGTVVTIDVDDWDAPCRRPDPLADAGDPLLDPSDGISEDGRGRRTLTGGDLALPGSLHPRARLISTRTYAPLSYSDAISGSAGTTIESFFLVSAPNRMRSNFLLRNDPTTGDHVPTVTAQAQLFDVTGRRTWRPTPRARDGSPVLLPTPLEQGFIDTTYFGSPTNADPSTRAPSSPLVSAAGQAKGMPRCSSLGRLLR